MSQYPGLVYRDRALRQVLEQATDEELRILVELMCTKRSCALSPDCREVLAIVNEFQRFGGHTFVNIVRGQGVSYREIVGDVADKLGIDFKGYHHIADAEWRIVECLTYRVLRKFEQVDADQMEVLREEMKKLGVAQNSQSLKNLLLNQAAYQSVRLIILQVIIREFVVKLGVQQAIGLVGSRIAAILTGPVGWALGGLWAAIDIAGPAYSVTVPGVLLVALIRLRLAAEEAARYIGGE